MPVKYLKGIVVWFTGLPCSGKTTLAEKLVEKFHEDKRRVVHIDGDVVREKIGGCGFTELDRLRHLRYMVYICQLFTEQGYHVIASFVSPIGDTRRFIKQMCDHVIEVYTDSPLWMCEARDVKGMYARARKGEIKNFTGVDATFEIPKNPDVHLDTIGESIDECLETLLHAVTKKLESRSK